MKKIAIYGKICNEQFINYIKEIFRILHENKIEIIVFKKYIDSIKELKTDFLKNNEIKTFNNISDFPNDIDIMVSIGGDGTFLETLPYLLKADIPVIGINTGRLGFLANISKENIYKAINDILEDKYTIEYRSLLELKFPLNVFEDNNFALNDITIQKYDLSMISIQVYLNGEYLTTYWTDGLIISTPTGSTAYSLSAGGPIIYPETSDLILVPIASHNLTVRPLIIPDDFEIKVNVSSRTNKFLLTADHKAKCIENNINIIVKKANVRIKMIRLFDHSFFKTLREKLMWGMDQRNN